MMVLAKSSSHEKETVTSAVRSDFSGSVTNCAKNETAPVA